MAEETVIMKVVNGLSAGIDVGSRSHFVAIGQNKEDVREFGVYVEDYQNMIQWLRSHNIITIAMESTGNYWQTLYSALQEAGFEVLLVNGKFAKNISGKKTDVLDCQWIQKMHTIGLLRGSFLPDDITEQLRTYCRHRNNLLDTAASTSKKMQKYLRLMNFRLDVVVKDVCGLTGLQIIESICNGESDPHKLASLRHYNCKKSELEISKALHGNGRKDYLFTLQQEYQTYKEVQEKIEECDLEIKKFTTIYIDSQSSANDLQTEDKIHKRSNKNSIKCMDVNQVAYKYFQGVDLMAIEGISHSTVLTIMSEIGPDGFKKFESSKQFTSWLSLSPNNKISGGKILSSKVKRGGNRLKIALRQAANVIGNLKNANLNPFFIRIAIRKGRSAAITATARKLATIIWNMIVKKESYNPPSQYEFLDQKRKRIVLEMRNKIARFDIKAEEISFC
jgi:transposase